MGSLLGNSIVAQCLNPCSSIHVDPFQSLFPKLFGTEKMSLTGELTVLLGVFAIYFFWLIKRFQSKPTSFRWWSFIELRLVKRVENHDLTKTKGTSDQMSDDRDICPQNEEFMINYCMMAYLD